MQFIESIYLLFQGLYSDSLRNYLSGYDCGTAGFSAPSQYGELGFYTAIVALIISGVYYKVIDPTSHKLFKWAMSLVVAMLSTASWAYYMVSSAENKGLIGDCLLRDDQGNALITGADYLGLATSNALITLALFFIFSLLIKYWSVNNRYIPF